MWIPYDQAHATDATHGDGPVHKGHAARNIGLGEEYRRAQRQRRVADGLNDRQDRLLPHEADHRAIQPHAEENRPAREQCEQGAE